MKKRAVADLPCWIMTQCDLLQVQLLLSNYFTEAKIELIGTGDAGGTCCRQWVELLESLWQRISGSRVESSRSCRLDRSLLRRWLIDSIRFVKLIVVRLYASSEHWFGKL